MDAFFKIDPLLAEKVCITSSHAAARKFIAVELLNKALSMLLNVFLLSVCAMNAIKIADCDCLARIRYILMIMLEKVLHIIWVVCN